MQKICSKCGAAFGCSGTIPGCWCESIDVSAETLSHLKEEYANCLCPQCLSELMLAGKEAESE